MSLAYKKYRRLKGYKGYAGARMRQIKPHALKELAKAAHAAAPNDQQQIEAAAPAEYSRPEGGSNAAIQAMITKAMGQ